MTYHFQQHSMKSYCCENNIELLQNSDAYKAVLFPSVALIKFLIIHVFKGFARIGHKSYWRSRILNKGISFLSASFFCLLKFTVRTGSDF